MPKHSMRRFWQDSRGAAALMTAIALFSMAAAAALSIDTSTFYVTKRKLQSAIDLAAIAAATNIPNARAVAQASLAVNGFPTVSVTVIPGVYTAAPSIPAASRFVPYAVPANAISIAATTSAPLIFGTIFVMAGAAQGTPSGGLNGSVNIGASATASATPVAAFAIGSRLARLDGGVANAVLSALTGSTISLSAVDYTSMTSARVDMGRYVQALAPSLGLSAGTYSQVLNAKLTLPTALAALDASGLDVSTRAAVDLVLNNLGRSGSTFSLNGLMDFGTYDTSAVTVVPPVTLTMTVYEVLSGVIVLASGGHQVVADLGAAVPGIADAKLTLVVGQRPVSATIVGTDQTTTATTVQVNLALVISASVGGLASVQLPLVLQLAKGVAETNGPTCTNGVPTLTLNVQPSVARLWVGQAAALPLPPAAPAAGAGPVATVLGLPIFASADAAISNSAPTPESFTVSDVANGTILTTSTIDPLATLLATSLGSMQFSVGGVGAPNLLPPALLGQLASGLQGLAVPADELLDSVTAALGIRIGQADTWVTDLACGAPMLAQ